jgi:hypothetical protein
MNNNLTSIDTLKRIARNKGLNKYYKEIGFSKVKNKKYYVITIDNKRVNFGYDKMQDYTQHKNKDRRDRFRARFKKLYDKFSNDFNKIIYWAYNLIW